MIVQAEVMEGEVAAFFQYLGTLLGEERFCDFSFKVGGQDIKAHRCVVAARSPVMKAMVEGPMEEALTQEVKLPAETHPVHFRKLLLYLYGQPCPLEPCEVVPILELASTFQVEGLLSKCEAILMSALDISNCTSILM